MAEMEPLQQWCHHLHHIAHVGPLSPTKRTTITTTMKTKITTKTTAAMTTTTTTTSSSSSTTTTTTTTITTISIYLRVCHHTFFNISFDKTNAKMTMLKTLFLLVILAISLIWKLLACYLHCPMVEEVPKLLSFVWT